MIILVSLPKITPHFRADIILHREPKYSNGLNKILETSTTSKDPK